MYILPEYRGNYLIRFLLSAIVKQARIENLHDLRLYVHEDNSKAIKAYLNNGFDNTSHKILSPNILNELD